MLHHVPRFNLAENSGARDSGFFTHLFPDNPRTLVPTAMGEGTAQLRPVKPVRLVTTSSMPLAKDEGCCNSSKFIGEVTTIFLTACRSLSDCEHHCATPNKDCEYCEVRPCSTNDSHGEWLTPVPDP
jgi:hypothetical protein